MLDEKRPMLVCAPKTHSKAVLQATYLMFLAINQTNILNERSINDCDSLQVEMELLEGTGSEICPTELQSKNRSYRA